MSRGEPTVNDVIKVGRVSAVFPERCTATVIFPDRDNVVSKELSIGQKSALLNRAEFLPDPGEHVICAFYGNGLSEGVVLCSIYDKANPPTVGNQERTIYTWPDGAEFFYDRKQHIMQFKDSYGAFMLFKNGEILLQGRPNIHLNPDDLDPEPIALHVGNIFD